MRYYIVFDPTDSVLSHSMVRQDGKSTGWVRSLELALTTNLEIDWEFSKTITPENITQQMRPDYTLLVYIDSDTPPTLDMLTSQYPELFL